MKPALRAISQRWASFWYGPVDTIRLDVFRTLLCYTLFAYAFAWFGHVDEWLTPAGYHPSVEASSVYAPRVPLLSSGLVAPAAIVFFGGIAAVILLGKNLLVRRIGLAIALAGVVYVTQADPISAFTINRLYIVALTVLLVAPAGTQSDDGEVQVAWPLRVLQLTLLIHYAAAGWCKAATGDWLAHDQVLWGQVQGVYMTDAAAWMVRTFPAWSWAVMQHVALWFELLAPLLFGIRRLRPVAFVVGVGMHLLVAVTMYKLVYFSLQMVCLYVLFIDPRWLHRLGRWVR